ncbi:MAG TPA: hypothetical protein VI454_13035, partial [Verrucomicrobiae bacterium]
EGTIDRRLEELNHEKGDAAELVIDGRLLQEEQIEVSLADLLRSAEAEFDPASETIDEAALEHEWPALRTNLMLAASRWRQPESMAGLAEPGLTPEEFEQRLAA